MKNCQSGEPKFSELYQQKYLDAFPSHPLTELNDVQKRLLWELRNLVDEMTFASTSLKYDLPVVEEGELKEFFERIAKKRQIWWGEWDIKDCVDELHKVADGRNKYSIEAEELTLKCVIVMTLYPFWSRMGGSFEKKFAIDGRLGKYLRILQEKDSYREDCSGIDYEQ